MFNKIKSKFIVVVLIFILLGVGIPIGFLIHQFRQNFEERSVLQLETTLDMLSTGLNNIKMMDSEKNVQNVVDKLALNKNINHIRIIDPDGEINYSSNHREVGSNINKISPRHVDLELKESRKINLLDELGVYVATEPIKNEKQCQSCHTEEGVISILDIDTHFTTAETGFYTGATHIIFMGIALVIVLSAGSYGIFYYFIDKPLRSFIGSLDRVEAGDLTTRRNEGRKDEFGIVNRHFNKMVEELETSREEIENFHYQKLQHADKLASIGELTAQVAHEINNHTAIIMSRADYISYELGNRTELNEYWDDFNTILKQTEKVSKITSNILRHSKKQEKNFTSFLLTDSVDESVQIFEPLSRKRDIGIVKNYTAEDSTIKGDTNQIHQILVNLINNALDSMEDKGTIEISVSNSAKNNVILSISDTGAGIPEDDINQIFSPFFTRKSKDKGTGLGLYIVKNICREHNAEITCSSRGGEGTTFTISFIRNNKV